MLNLHGHEETPHAVIYILVAQVLINTMSVHIEARDFSPEMEKAPQLIGCGAWKNSNPALFPEIKQGHLLGDGRFELGLLFAV